MGFTVVGEDFLQARIQLAVVRALQELSIILMPPNWMMAYFNRRIGLKVDMPLETHRLPTMFIGM
ncbi:hypothetical protein [Sodalis-like endosymbiont of Proechinophthirus fluctus]|uniref:hypothetical protein n=1 Tax=Sodalis-like endosymbiont of Proechinophthirus fluctus TaxID=1462730 RepID=UPI0008295929|nr:hypothetical protein [Sodalis-like endosymbiont of Proechinophthirus fluctus]